MGTGVVSALIHLFPYHNESQALKIIACIFFLLNLVLFVFVCTCTVLRYVMFPEVRYSKCLKGCVDAYFLYRQVWPLMLSHTAQSLFVGCFPMGAATLINAGLVSVLYQYT